MKKDDLVWGRGVCELPVYQAARLLPSLAPTRSSLEKATVEMFIDDRLLTIILQARPCNPTMNPRGPLIRERPSVDRLRYAAETRADPRLRGRDTGDAGEETLRCRQIAGGTCDDAPCHRLASDRFRDIWLGRSMGQKSALDWSW